MSAGIENATDMKQNQPTSHHQTYFFVSVHSPGSFGYIDNYYV